MVAAVETPLRTGGPGVVVDDKPNNGSSPNRKQIFRGPGVDERPYGETFEDEAEKMLLLSKHHRQYALLSLIERNDIGKIEKIQRIKFAEYEALLPTIQNSLNDIYPEPTKSLSLYEANLLKDWNFDIEL